MDYGILFKNLFKMCVAGVITLALCLIASAGFDQFITLPKYVFELVKIIVIGTLCLAIYVPLNLVLKMDYANELFERVKNKFVR